MMTFEAPPVLFVGLTDDDDEISRECLARLRNLWSALEKLEAVIHSNEKAARFHQTLLWPWEHWAREMFLALYECDFAECPQWMRAELMQFSQAHFSTDMVENLANATRRLNKDSSSGKFCSKSVWHSCTFGSTVCTDFDRPTSKPSNAARNMARCLPKRLFKFEGKSCSIPSDKLRGLTAEVPRYPIASPDVVAAWWLDPSDRRHLLVERSSAAAWWLDPSGRRRLLVKLSSTASAESSGLAWWLDPSAQRHSTATEPPAAAGLGATAATAAIAATAATADWLAA